MEILYIADQNFKPLIDRALFLPGFEDDVDNGKVTVGFAHNAVLGVADKMIEAIKNKDTRHFFLVAGCDGAKPGRNYYTEFVEKVPKDCVVLTLACGKVRFFDKNWAISVVFLGFWMQVNAMMLIPQSKLPMRYPMPLASV